MGILFVFICAPADISANHSVVKNGVFSRMIASSIEEKYLDRSLLQIAVSIYEMFLKEEIDDERRASFEMRLSEYLASYGDLSNSLNSITRAATIFKNLAESNFIKYGLIFAICMRSLSTRLSENGEHAESLRVIQHAIQILKLLQKQHIHVGNIDMAMYASALSTLLADNGDHTGSLTTIRVVVEVLSKLESSERTLHLLASNLMALRRFV